MNYKNELNLTKACIIVSTCFMLLITVFYFAAGEQLYFRESKHGITTVTGDIATGEITPSFIVKETFLCEMSRIRSFSIQLATYARNNTGDVIVKLIDETDNTVLKESIIDISKLTDSAITEIDLGNPVGGVYSHYLAIEISSKDGISGNAVGPWYLSTVNTKNMQLYFNNAPVAGTLCFSTYGDDDVWAGPHYWVIMGILELLIITYCINLIWRNKLERKSWGLVIISILRKYKFLIKQLVFRDFKIKYKRSVLGVCWSFVNPLLTMSVQYFVFSTIFKADIKHYPVYLLAGVVFFSFFQEATGASIGAIIGNATLINKVYVPKYIYPVSKVLSSSVNMLIALIPLFVMCVATKVSITKAWIIIPFILVCLLLFSMGIGFILSAAMVFFRDVQFIWNVVSLVWMYATPVFYPENILPQNMRWVLEYNPMYFFIQFFRTLVINGVSPEPMIYLKCLGASIISLVAGIWIFRKSQDKFVFYI